MENKVSNQQVEAKKFIEENDLEKIVSEMMNSVVYEKSKQPIVYMIKYLAGLLSEEERKMHNLIIPEPYPKCRPIVKFPNLEKLNNPLKNVLTKTIWPNIKYKKTKFGGTVMNLMKISENKISEKIGVLLTDGDCINTFDELLTPIINIVNKTENQKLEEFIPDPTLSNSAHFPFNEKILFNTKLIRISYSRNLQDYPFTSLINEKNRGIVENSIVTAINNLLNEKIIDNGKYFYLKDNENETINKLKETLHDYDEIENLMNSAELKSSKIIFFIVNFCLDWPNNRCVFTSDNEEISILILINFVDHVKLITTVKDKNSDFSRLFNLSHHIIKNLEKYLTFEFDKTFGFTNSCLDNLGAGMEISSLISLKNIINSENFDNEIYNFNLDSYKSDKINCQFFSKKKFKLCDKNQLEFIQNYYNFISGLINLDNKFDSFENEKNFIFNFSELSNINNYSSHSQEVKSNEPFKFEINNNNFDLKVKSVARAYFKTNEKYKNIITPLGSTLNDLINNFNNKTENNLTNNVFFSDSCEYLAFKDFISQFILNYQFFNVEEFDHIYKQDAFKTLPNIPDKNKDKIVSLKMTCMRNISDYLFGLNNKVFDSAAKVMELTIQCLENLKIKYEFIDINSENFLKFTEENEINLNIPNSDNKLVNYPYLDLTNRGLIKLENNDIYILLNDIDHLRFECNKNNGELNKMFINILTFINQLAKNLKFSYDKKLGFLTSNPIYIGTGLIIEVVVKNQFLINNENKLNEILKDYFKYEIINKEEGLIKITNHTTIGISENDLLGNFIIVINELIENDKE